MTSPDGSMNVQPEPAITINGVAVLRLIQIDAYARDLVASPDPERLAKKEALEAFISDTARLAGESWNDPFLKPLGQLTLVDVIGERATDDPTHDPDGRLEALAHEIVPHLHDAERDSVIVQLGIATRWPSGIRWTHREAALGFAAAHMLGETEPDEAIMAMVMEIVWAHKRARRRLGKDSASPGSQITLGAVMAAATVAAPGVSNALGTFVGTHFLGLSGAAATSAGLALLGGGSLASGGFGMAGGVFLVSRGAHAAAKGGYRLLATLASDAPAEFIDQLAALDVAVAFGTVSHDLAVEALQGANQALLDELNTLRPKAVRTRRRANVAKLGRSIVAMDPTEIRRRSREVKSDLPGEKERHLAKCQRAVDFELRYLNAPNWKRNALAVPRFLGVPAAGKLLEPQPWQSVAEGMRAVPERARASGTASGPHAT